MTVWSRSHGRRVLLAATLPLLLLAVDLRVQLSGAELPVATAPVGGADAGRAAASCPFPGTGARHQRLVVAIVDSLRDETALDAGMMPWLVKHRQQALWGRMQPCLAQLSLICFRTMFEGSEPLITAGLNNFQGMTVGSPSLVQRLAARGVRVAAIADLPFIRLYQSSLARAASFEERPSPDSSRDAWAHETTFDWLADPTLDVIITHTIDTDAVAHRRGVGHPEYVEKFRETDRFLEGLAGRLGAQDSLLILGDHGHDARGYHSTGIPSTTVYFASGAAFVAGRHVDLTMPSTYGLMGRVTCEPAPPGYAGDGDSDTLAFAGQGAVTGASGQGRGPSAPPPARPSIWKGRLLTAELPAVLTLLALVALLARALHPERTAPRAGVAPTLVLLPALALPHAVALWGAAALATPATTPGGWFAERWQRWSIRGLVLVALALGFGARVVLVTLQSEVNPGWSIGFWCVLALTIVVAGGVLRWLSALPARISIGFAAWGVTFFVLYLGPYYYSSARNLLFGLTWLLLAQTWSGLRARRDLVRCVALALVPLIPLHLPVMKEWQTRYVLLDFANRVGPLPLVVLCAAIVAAAVAVSPNRFMWRRGLPLIAAMIGIGLITESTHVAILGEVLLAVSYLGFQEAVARISGDVRSGHRYLLPIAQATYTFFIFYLLLGSLRFANVDFRFALRFASIEGGEGAAALHVLPLVVAKYLAPPVLLIGLGPRLDGRGLLLLLIKGTLMVVCLFGMSLAAARSTALFELLESQEIALYALLYLSVLVAYAFEIGRRPWHSTPPWPAAAVAPGDLPAMSPYL